MLKAKQKGGGVELSHSGTIDTQTRELLVLMDTVMGEMDFAYKVQDQTLIDWTMTAIRRIYERRRAELKKRSEQDEQNVQGG